MLFSRVATIRYSKLLGNVWDQFQLFFFNLDSELFIAQLKMTPIAYDQTTTFPMNFNYVVERSSRCLKNQPYCTNCTRLTYRQTALNIPETIQFLTENQLDVSHVRVLDKWICVIKGLNNSTLPCPGESQNIREKDGVLKKHLSPFFSYTIFSGLQIG